MYAAVEWHESPQKYKKRDNKGEQQSNLHLTDKFLWP